MACYPVPPVTQPQPIYLFADWSFSLWSTEKRNALLQQMTDLIAAGNTLYIWDGKNKKLVSLADQKQLAEIINQEDLDDLWSDKVTPISQKQLLDYAQKQHLNTSNITIFDYQACNQHYSQNSSFERLLENAAPLFTSHYTPSDLKKAKRDIVAIEMDNAQQNTTLLASLAQILTKIEDEPIATPNYRSGIDTNGTSNSSQRKKPIFSPLHFMTPTPSSRYYRNEVYSELTINPKPTSPFDYFELSGMHELSDLKPTTYQFHQQLSNSIIKERKKRTSTPLFLGEFSLNLSQEWQALPSLSRGEVLLDIMVQGLKATDVEIQYSKKSGLYFMRHTRSIERPSASIKMLLAMPTEYNSFPPWNTFRAIPGHEDIHALLMKYYRFGKNNKELLNEVINSGQINNGIDYLQEARRLNTGSCRLRAIAFKEEMSRLHPEIPVAIDINSDHGFIEMELDGHWQRYCLGGYRNISTPVNKPRDHNNSCSTSNLHSFFHCSHLRIPEHHTSSLFCPGKR